VRPEGLGKFKNSPHRLAVTSENSISFSQPGLNTKGLIMAEGTVKTSNPSCSFVYEKCSGRVFLQSRLQITE
jgi:hypothetical protein